MRRCSAPASLCAAAATCRTCARGWAAAGSGILYLSLYASHASYGFLGAQAAFGAMLLVTAAGVAVAVLTSRQAIAVLAVLGGLLTPVLVTTESPDEHSCSVTSSCSTSASSPSRASAPGRG